MKHTKYNDKTILFAPPFPPLLSSIGLYLAVQGALAPVPALAAPETIVYPDNGTLSVIENEYGMSLQPSGSDDGKSNSLSGNSITVHSGGTVPDSVYGAINKLDNEAVTDNHVFIKSGGAVESDVYGGKNDHSTASSNTVHISGGSVRYNVYGGQSRHGSVSSNTVTISDGSVGSSVYGGSTEEGDATGNTVKMSGGTVDGVVSGGITQIGNTTDNVVRISDGTVTESVYGGSVVGAPWWSPNSTKQGGAATGNTVQITGGAVDLDVFGGYSDKSATGNTVQISGGTVGRNVFGGSSSDSPTGNTVQISGGTVAGNVVGGDSSYNIVTGNTVQISGGTVAGNVVGGDSSYNIVTGNTVQISGGTVAGDVLGGLSARGIVTGNTVQISSGTVTGKVVGGYSRYNTVTGNTVTIQGAPDLSAASLYGGITSVGLDGSAPGDAFTGNTLNLHVPGFTVSNVKSFEYLNFFLPSTLGAGATMLAVTGTAELRDDAGRSSTINVGIEGSSSPLQIGDSVVLIDAETLITSKSGLNTTATGLGMQGVSLRYDFDLLVQNNQLLAKVTSGEGAAAGPTVHPQTKALSEGRIAGLAFVNQGVDLVAGQGMSSALAATAGPGTSRSSGFAAISGGDSRYDTGSHVNVDGFSLMTGFGWQAPLASNSLLLGAFFETGRGNYDSHNSFSNAARVKGSGDTEYYGGGLFARYDLTGGVLAGSYAEASFRAGHVSTDFSSNDLLDASGRRASYDSGSSYYGAHAGIGYIHNVTDKISLDFSSKYLWTHQGGDHVTLTTGDPIRFHAVDSHRWRNGIRLNYAVEAASGALFTSYIGAAYDREFDGKAHAMVHGYSIDAPELKGGTAIAELGVSFNPMAGRAFSVDLGIQGYTGAREGVRGNLDMKYAF